MQSYSCIVVAILLFTPLFPACGGSGAQPHDMTEEEHLRMAAGQERIMAVRRRRSSTSRRLAPLPERGLGAA